MGGFVNTLGAIGKTMLDNSSGVNRYRQIARMVHRPATQPNEQTQYDTPPMQNAPVDNPADPTGPMGVENAAKGVLVTQPTIARIGERGPEAIVPLNNAAGNHVRPDLLEGHLQAPKVPGMRYQQFKQYTRPTY